MAVKTGAAAPEKATVGKLLELVRGECKGPCIGTGVGIQVIHSPCPEPCNQDTLKLVRERAQNEAWRKAQEMCNKSEFCTCWGRHDALIPEQCVPIKDADGQTVCLYFAAYAYVGKCTILV